MISNVLQIKNLQKEFKDTQVVNLSSLSVQQGEIYGFLGPNGAGKTTTMKMILSLISRTAGEIEVMNSLQELTLEELDNVLGAGGGVIQIHFIQTKQW